MGYQIQEKEVIIILSSHPVGLLILTFVSVALGGHTAAFKVRDILSVKTSLNIELNFSFSPFLAFLLNSLVSC